MLMTNTDLQILVLLTRNDRGMLLTFCRGYGGGGVVIVISCTVIMIVETFRWGGVTL